MISTQAPRTLALKLPLAESAAAPADAKGAARGRSLQPNPVAPQTGPVGGLPSGAVKPEPGMTAVDPKVAELLAMRDEIEKRLEALGLPTHGSAFRRTALPC